MTLEVRSRSELLAIIQRQQQEIDGLRSRIEVLESADLGQLRQELEELRAWKDHANKQIHELQISSAMTQGLVFFGGIVVLALLGERFLEATKDFPNRLDEEKLAELREKLGELGVKIVNAIQEIDRTSRGAWEKQRVILERRAVTLPPLKRALFRALDQLARPSKMGTQLLAILLQTQEFTDTIGQHEQETIELVATMLDTASNLWPLASVNSLVPILRYVGWDDAAEAAGEVLDSLEHGNDIPRHLIHRVKPDLVAMSAVKSRTKPSTIAEYLKDGFELTQRGLSADQAAALGCVASSPTQLKRADRAFRGLRRLYDRNLEYRNDEDEVGRLETLSNLWSKAIKDIENWVALPAGAE